MSDRRSWRIGVVQIAALAIAFVVIGIMFGRLEANTNGDIREQRRVDIATCETGQRLADAQRAQINQIAGYLLFIPMRPEQREALEHARQDQLALIPVFDCDTLPKP